MNLTLRDVLNSRSVFSSAIDRALQLEKDTIYWKRYLDFERIFGRTFTTYYGTVTGVTMGSIIDRNSNKPIRERKSVGKGYGEVATIANAWQIDLDRLEFLDNLVETYNNQKTKGGKDLVMDDILSYLIEDYREAMLAPHKRMDYVVGQLRSTGKASVKTGDNQYGVEMIDIELPVINLTPSVSEKDSLIRYIQSEVEKLRSTTGQFSVMEMTRSTFNNRIANTSSFQNAYKMIFGSSEIAVNGGLITDKMVNQLLIGVGLPPIRLIEEYVKSENGENINTFADDRISILPSDKIGKMMWKMPLEAKRDIVGKSMEILEGGHLISTKSSEEGDFIEYKAEWIPNIKSPNKIAIINTENLG